MRLFPKHSTRLHPRSLLLAADVEGAEYEVLKNANPRAFSVVLVETQGGSREKNRAVHQLLTSSGLQVSSEVRVPSSSVYVRPELQLTIAQPVLPPALRMSDARPGHCGATIDRDPGNCNAGDKGSWRISRFRKFNVSSCIHRCKFECPRCRYISVSLQAHDCSWYASCDLERLELGTDHQSIAAVGVRLVSDLYPSSPASEPNIVKDPTSVTPHTSQ